MPGWRKSDFGCLGIAGLPGLRCLKGMIEIAELRELPLHEKLRMMEALWDGIAPSEAELELPQWHKDLLDEREQLLREGKAGFIDGEVAKEQIREAIS